MLRRHGHAWATLLLGCTCACVLIVDADAAVAQAAQGSEPPQLLGSLERTELAITVDDLPAHSDAHPGMSRIDIAAEMIAALKGAEAPPTYGFANGTPMLWDPVVTEVLNLWHDAGFLLANHTFSHLDLGQVSAEIFIGDIEKMEQALTPWVSASPAKLFRYPYLSEGDTHAKRRTVREYLQQHEYRIAPVTVDYNDWAWSAAYTRCSLVHDEGAMQQLEEQVVTAARRTLREAQHQAKFLVGRDIKHILLLHISALTARTLPAMLAAFQADGVKLVSLPVALEDPVYQIDPNQLGQRDMTFLMQLRMSRKGDEGSTRSADPSVQFDPVHDLCRP